MQREHQPTVTLPQMQQYGDVLLMLERRDQGVVDGGGGGSSIGSCVVRR